MYASYFYNANANPDDVLNDIVAILTGENKVDNLSLSCDKNQTQIKVDYSVSGWSLEGRPSANQVVLSSPHTQDNTRKKLLVLDSSSLSSDGYLKIGSAKSYNSNNLESPYFLSSSESPKVDLTNGGRLEIYADSKIILFLSYVGGAFSAWSGICELSLTPYENKGWGLIRSYNVAVAEVYHFNGSIYFWMSVSFVLSIGRSPALDGSIVESTRLFVSSSGLKIFSEITSVYVLPDRFGAVFDTIVYPDGKTYVIWTRNGNERRVAVPWG